MALIALTVGSVGARRLGAWPNREAWSQYRDI